MEIGSPVEDQCVRMWRLVYSNAGISFDEARVAFHMQNPAIIDGWERLAKSVMEVTTTGTFAHLSEKHKPKTLVEIFCPTKPESCHFYHASQEEQDRMAQ